MNEIDDLLQDIARPDIWVEVVSLLVCLALAYFLCRLAYKAFKPPQDSVWLGRHLLDGLMFPFLALTLTFATSYVVARYQHLSVLKVAVPMLVSLAAIRLTARTLTLSFPKSGFARLTERLFSWVVWVLAILWIVGLLPGFLEEMGNMLTMLSKSFISL